jgi:hypothetical protein
MAGGNQTAIKEVQKLDNRRHDHDEAVCATFSGISGDTMLCCLSDTCLDTFKVDFARRKGNEKEEKEDFRRSIIHWRIRNDDKGFQKAK